VEYRETDWTGAGAGNWIDHRNVEFREEGDFAPPSNVKMMERHGAKAKAVAQAAHQQQHQAQQARPAVKSQPQYPVLDHTGESFTLREPPSRQARNNAAAEKYSGQARGEPTYDTLARHFAEEDDDADYQYGDDFEDSSTAEFNRLADQVHRLAAPPVAHTFS
jgi:hypothetical protein